MLRKQVINNDEDDADDDGNALSPTHKLCEYLAGDMRALTEYLPYFFASGLLSFSERKTGKMQANRDTIFKSLVFLIIVQ